MRLIALLCWYDEPAWCLVELIGSLVAAGVDHVVAVDGAYALYPEGRAQSPGEQAQAVLAACNGAHMGCSLHVPQDIWIGNEIQKRTFMFAAGHLVAEPGVDWLWPVDGDEVVTEAIGLRDALERTDLDAGEALMDRFSDEGPEGVQPIRKFFRAQPDGIWLEHNHFTYMTSGGRMLWEGMQHPKPHLVDAEPLHFVRFAHRVAREDARLFKRQAYYDRRKKHGVELVPG